MQASWIEWSLLHPYAALRERFANPLAS